MRGGTLIDERAALQAEIIRWRTATVAAIVLSIGATGPALVVLLSPPPVGAFDGLAVCLWSLLVTGVALALVIGQADRCAYLDAALRYFAPPSAELSLSELASDRRWNPWARRRNWQLLGASAEAACTGAVVGAWLAYRSHSWLPVLGVSILAALNLFAWGAVLLGRDGRRTDLELLADGMTQLRSGAEKVIRIENLEIIRIDGQGDVELLKVRALPRLPPAHYAATAFYGPDGYEVGDPDPPWTVYKRSDARATGRPAGDVFHTVVRPFSTWVGPVLAAVLLAVGALLLAISINRGAPRHLPGWSLDAPLLYESARVAAVLVSLLVVGNLLLAMAAGRLISKVTREGVEFEPSATSKELARSDVTTAATLASLEDGFEALHKAVEFIAAEQEKLSNVVEPADIIKRND